MSKHVHKLSKWKWNGAQFYRECIAHDLRCAYSEFCNIDKTLRRLNRPAPRYRKVGEILSEGGAHIGLNMSHTKGAIYQRIPANRKGGKP